MQTSIHTRTVSTLRSDDIDGARPNKFKHSKRGYFYELKSPYTDYPTAPTDTSMILKSPYESHDIYHPAKITAKITHNPTLSPERLEANNHYANISKIASGTGLQNQNTTSPQTTRRYHQSQEPRQSNTQIPIPPNYSIDSMRNPMYADHNYSQSRSLSQSPYPAPTNEYEKNKLLLQSGQTQNQQYPEQRQSNLLRNSTNGVSGHGLNNIITNNNPSNYMVSSPKANTGSKFGSQTPNAQNDLRDSVDHLKSHMNAASHTPNHSTAKILPDLTPIKKDLHKFYGVTPPPSRYGEYYNRIHYEKPNNPPEQMRESFYNNMTRRAHYRANEDPQFKKALNKFFNSPLSQQETFQINKDAFYRGYTPVVGQQRKFVGVTAGLKGVNRYGDPLQEKSYELDLIAHSKVNQSGIRFTQSPLRESVQREDPRYQVNQQRVYN